jgi:hypothetical protein
MVKRKKVNVTLSRKREKVSCGTSITRYQHPQITMHLALNHKLQMTMGTIGFMPMQARQILALPLPYRGENVVMGRCAKLWFLVREFPRDSINST